MNLFALSGLLIGITNLFMIGIMFLQGRNRLHRLWLLFCIAASFWGWGGYAIATTTDPKIADFWWRFTHIGVILIPIFFTHFVYHFLNIKKRWFILSIYILGGIFLFTNFISNLFIANMRWVFNEFYYDSPPGPFYIPFTALFFGLVLYSHYELWKGYRKASGLQRTQIKYFFFGMAISFAGGSLSFLPVYKIDLYPVFNITAFLYPLIVGYAILRFRLFDIHLIIRRGFVRVVLAVFAYATFYFFSWFFVRAFGTVWEAQAMTLGVFIAIAFSFAWPCLEKLAFKFSNKYLYASIYRRQETMRDLARDLTKIIDLNKIITLITDAVIKLIYVERAAILLKINGKQEYRTESAVGFTKKDIDVLLKNNIIPDYCAKTRQLVIKDEATIMSQEANNKESNVLKKTVELMSKAGVEVFLPLITKETIIGFILLSQKTTKDAYTKEDIELLETFGNQAAIAIENARLYNNMEAVVEAQTRDLKEKNIHLQKLLKMRSEFLDVASHQLRTPLSVIKGYISMLREGDFDHTDKEERDDVYKAIADKTEKIIRVANDLLYSSELDTGTFVIRGNELSVFELEPYLLKIIESCKEQAHEKEISLNLEKPTSPCLVKASDRYLGIVLDNLLQNALQYIKEGGTIKVSVTLKAKVARILISDNGIGVPKEDQKEIFQKFKRGANANNIYTDGTGLGLFIAKQMIEAHPKGRIGFESEEGKGSTFWVEIEKA